MGTELHLGGEFVPVPDCAGGKDVASVVCEASLVLEAVVASSSTCRLEFEVRAPHTHLTSGDLVQRMVRRTFILSSDRSTSVVVKYVSGKK